MDVGEAIKKCRHERGWSQNQLSYISGIARSTISCTELNRRGTSVCVFEELLNAMGYELKIVDKKQPLKERDKDAVIFGT